MAPPCKSAVFLVVTLLVKCLLLTKLFKYVNWDSNDFLYYQIPFHKFSTVLAAEDGDANGIKDGDCTTNDFSPCECYQKPGQSQVICSAVNMTLVRDGPLSRVENFDFYELYLSPLKGDFIPANFIQSAIQRIQTLTIDCFAIIPDVLIQVDPLAFESDLESSEYDSIGLSRCYFPDLNFFSGIKKACQLLFSYNSNVHDILQSIPIEFQLDSMSFQSCDNLDLTYRFPSLIYGLAELIMNFNSDFSDDAMDRYLQWMVSTSADTLVRLDISSNELTKIPTLPLSRLNNLISVNLNNNPFQSGILQKGSLSFAYPLSSISLYSCKIKTIEPGAFEGKFFNCII